MSQPINIVILYRRGAEPDSTLMRVLEAAFSPPEYSVFIDRHLKIGVEWARLIEEKIRGADIVIALLSEASLTSEMLEYEIEIALDERMRHGKLRLFPVRIGTPAPPTGTVGALIGNLQYAVWSSEEDTPSLMAEVIESMDALEAPASDSFNTFSARAVPSESPFYIPRTSDKLLMEYLMEQESLILVKGPRQVGKTSLVGHGIRMQMARGGRFVTSDFQRLASVHLEDADACYRVLAADIDRQLKLNYDFDGLWLPMFGPGSNMHNFLRTAVMHDPRPLAWFMDEVDRLFACPFSGEFFSLVRSWHNAQSMEPDVDWGRLSIVITYATEAHLFIQDLNQSPFNVGRQLELTNFNFSQVEDLNERYGKPFPSVDQLSWLHEMVKGQPFLTRRAMDFMVRGGDLTKLMRAALLEDGPFGDHLKRVLVSVSQLDGVMSALRASLSNVILQDSRDVQRLLAAGILERKPEGNYAIRGKLYREYLASHIGVGSRK